MPADNDYTYQGLLEELRTAYESHSGSRPDDASDAGIRLRVLAGQLFALHSRISWIQRQFFPSTATGAQLDQLAAMWGLARKEASFAEGMLQFARPEAETLPEIQLPSGILCAAPGTQGKQFITLESSALPEGATQTLVCARALEPGAGFNVAAGKITIPVNPPQGVTQVTNPSPFDGGADAETDEHLRIRLASRLGQMPNGANASTYREKALAYDGVLEASVLPRARGKGTVDVILLTAAETPEDALLAQVQADLSSDREIGTDVLVRGAVRTPVSLCVKVLVAYGYNGESVAAQCKAALRGMLEALPLGEPLLTARIGETLFHIEGVANYTLESPEEDLLFSADAKLTPGTITVQLMQ